MTNEQVLQALQALLAAQYRIRAALEGLKGSEDIREAESELPLMLIECADQASIVAGESFSELQEFIEEKLGIVTDSGGRHDAFNYYKNENYSRRLPACPNVQ